LRLIFKFGGTSIGDGERIRRCCGIVRDYVVGGNNLAVVCSALGGTTDNLLEMISAAEKGDGGLLEKKIGELREAHVSATLEAIPESSQRSAALSFVEERLAELTHVLKSIYFLREATPRSRDLVLSFGERLSTWIFTQALSSLGVKAKYLEGGEAGIVTDNYFGYATPLLEETLYRVKNTLLPLMHDGLVPVVTGFIGMTREGIVTTLGRGGSDLTATLLGSAIHADEVILWTDVDGLLTADPRIVRGSKTISQLSYEEALEMAVFGAKGLHPRAIEVAQLGRVNVRIRNTFNPAAPGTLITSTTLDVGSVVKGVLLVKGVAMITVKGSSSVGKPGSAARILDSLATAGINVHMISQSVSESGISLIVGREYAEKALEAIRMSSPPGSLRGVECEDDVVVVAVVGEGMKGTPGVASRVFGAVARRGINVRMIAQGSSELNISFVVKESDGVEAVRAIHEEYGLGSA